MTTPMDVGRISRSPVVRPARSATAPAIVHPRRCGCGRAACREAAREPVTVLAEVVHVDSPPQVPRPRAEVGPDEASDGWAQVGQWLAFVAALSALALTFALLGSLTAR